MDAQGQRIRVGAFELDPRSGDLWRDGRCRALPEQPLAVLKALLQRPGDIVRREELCQLLWPSGTFVDFEHGLNAAVKRLRDALGDTADVPGYIETIPRRGYRLIAPVDTGDVPDDQVLPSARLRRSAWLASTGLLGALLTVGVLAWHRGSSVRVETGGAAPATRFTQLTHDTGWTTEPAISLDGQLLAYASDRGGGGNFSIWVQRMSGGAPRRLTRHSANDHEPAFSPDGTRIVFRSEREGGGLYTIPAHTDGREELLVAGGHDPSYSPDGRFVAYWTGFPQTDTCDPTQNRVFVVASGGGTATPIAPQLVGGCWPVWAPDSKHLLITTQLRPDGDFRWLVVPIAGGSPVDTGLSEMAELRDFFHAPRQRVWSQRGIVFEASWRMRPKILWEVHIAPDTRRVRGPGQQLTTATEEHYAPSLSADGLLVFGSHSPRMSLWSLPADTDDGVARGEPRRVTPGVQFDRLPTVSLDGESLAFARVIGEEQAIFVLNSRTGVESERVATGHVGFPSISPDGSKLAYGRSDTIELVSASGSEPERLTADGDACSPEGWSHDNTSLLYEHFTAEESQVVVLSLKTGRKQLLAARKGRPLYQARFSPDDRWVSFLERVGERQRVWLVRVEPHRATDASSWIPVTPDRWFDDKPRWSPNGRLLYFLSDRDGFRCIWAQRLDEESRQPEGAPFAVYHMHGARLSMMNALVWDLGFDVARDRLIFNMGERTGNIWTTTLDPHR